MITNFLDALNRVASLHFGDDGLLTVITYLRRQSARQPGDS